MEVHPFILYIWSLIRTTSHYVCSWMQFTCQILANVWMSVQNVQRPQKLDGVPQPEPPLPKPTSRSSTASGLTTVESNEGEILESDESQLDPDSNEQPRTLAVAQPSVVFPESHRSGLHPIHHMPDEVLREIFLFRVQMEWGDKGFQKSWPTPAWTIANVCVRWKNIALETCQLWSYIQFHYPSRRHINYQHLLVGVYANRAKSSPLSLHIEIEAEPPDDYILDLQRMVPSTCSFSYRMRPTGLRSGLSRRLGRFRMLSNLELQGVEDFGDTFLNCPELRRASIHFRSWSCWSSVRLPWSRLASLTASASCGGDDDWRHFSGFLGLLHQATSLQELRLLVHTDPLSAFRGSLEPIGRGALATIHLERLQHLALVMDGEVQRAWLPILLQILSTPNLRHLALNTLGEPLLPASASKLLSMLRSLNHGLRSLSLGLCPSTQLEILSSILFSIPFVRTLSLRLSPGYGLSAPSVTLKRIIRLLTLKRGNSVLPLLSSLKLCDDAKTLQGSRFSSDVIKMLKSRDSPRLEMLSLAFDEEERPFSTTDEEMNWISEYQKRGMYFNLTNNLSTTSREVELDWYMPLAVV